MNMYRYMAFMWSRTDREASMAAKYLATTLPEVSPHMWSQAWAGTGLAIYHSGEQKGRMQTYRLQDECGAVLGRLFRSNYTSVVDDLDDFESRKCIESRGLHLIDNYWGRYVAFLSDEATGSRYVMRDPTGAFPCFLTSFQGVQIYFSDMQDVANFEFLPFTVNWEFLKAEIMLPGYQKTATGLNEVREVLPAECVEVTPFESKSRFVWNPVEVSQTNPVEDSEEAVELLRETVKSTVGALAGCYSRIIHNLGGLDSSIALACIAQAPKRPEVTCINLFTKSPRGEERYYSRQVAEKYNIELVERELNYRKVDLNKIISANKMAAPKSFYDCIALTGDELGLAREKGAEALFYGVGGDQVFYQPPFNLGAVDYARCHGLLGKHTLKVAMEASRYGRRSLVKTYRDMLRERFAPAPCYQYVYDTLYGSHKVPLVDSGFVSGGEQQHYLHPLLRPNDWDLKGKYLHILCCALHPKEYYNNLDTAYYVERMRLFFAQPIIELCLRIRTWTMTYGGVDRGLARMAFQSDLPKEVVTRLSKSTPDEYYNDVYDHNLHLLRDYLRDGVLVHEGVLRRDEVEVALSKQSVLNSVTKFRTISFFATEIWLRSWLDRRVAKPQIQEGAG